MIIQYYKGGLNIAKVVIDGKSVTFYDSGMFSNGINALHVLSKDREKLAKWKLKIKMLDEKGIAKELKEDFKKDLGLNLSSEEEK